MYLFDISNEEECTAKDEKITYSIWIIIFHNRYVIIYKILLKQNWVHQSECNKYVTFRLPKVILY
jgi:hypothetical protein